MALLEVPFSLPFAAVLGVVLVILGALLLFNMAVNLKRSANKNAVVNGLLMSVEIVVLVIIGLLSIAGGSFSLWIYFKSTTLPTMLRLTMFTVLGASITVILSVNLLDLCELTLRCCSERQVGPLKVSRPGKRLFPLRAQNWLIIFVAAATGVYYGYMYGNLAKKQLMTVDVSTRYNPWPAVYQYLEYSLPVAAVGGFVAVCIALMLPHVLATGSVPAWGQAGAGSAKKNDDVAAKAPLLGAAGAAAPAAAGAAGPSPVGQPPVYQ